MVIIQFHKGGWAASNDAEIKNTPKIIKTPDSKVVQFRDSLSLEIRGVYVVSGKFEGDVNIAIRDSQTDELKCYKGIVKTNSKVEIESEIDSNWLKKI